MKKVAILFSSSSCTYWIYTPVINAHECHAAADIAGAEYELEELGEYCGDEAEESIEASGYDIADTLYLTADGDSLPSPVYPGTVEVYTVAKITSIII